MAPWGTEVRPACRPARTDTLAERGEGTGRREERRQCAEVRQPPPCSTAGVPGARLSAACRLRRRCRFGQVAVATAPATDRWRRQRDVLGRLDPAPAGLRPPDAIGAGRPVDGAGRREHLRVGRPQLEHVESIGRLARAVADPFLDRVGAGVEQLVEPLPLVGRKRGEDVVGEAATGRPDPDPQPAELLGAQLVDDRAEAVVAARTATLAEAELAERQREVVGDDEQVDQRRVLAGEHLADGEARLVHERQRLDDHQVEPAVAAHGDRRGVARPALAGPARPVGDAVEDHPADVVPRLRVLLARIPQADDDLHRTSRARDDLPHHTPNGPDPVREGPRRW